jgi:RNA polymerase sigma-70 factor, ECF subfamily
LGGYGVRFNTVRRLHSALMEPGRPDEELMLAYGAGDAAAFDALYARHKGAVLRYLRRQTGNTALAEELFQDVWLKLIDARAGYEPRAKFTTWLFTIAPAADVPTDMPRPDQTAERRETAAQLLAAIDALPAAQREAFLLQQEGELSVEEIAAATGVNRETAKSRLRYAMTKLRATLREPERT